MDKRLVVDMWSNDNLIAKLTMNDCKYGFTPSDFFKKTVEMPRICVMLCNPTSEEYCRSYFAEFAGKCQMNCELTLTNTDGYVSLSICIPGT